LRDRRLSESSGIVVSRTQPGVLWTFNDSGNPAELFATDTAGDALGRWSVTGAVNNDWEAMTLGPGPCGGGSCLYIGDIGDNNSRRAAVTIYRVNEPLVRATDTTLRASPVVASLTLRYPDGPHDAESLIADSTGDLFIITKPRIRSPEVFRIPATAWGRRDTVAAQLTDTLPLDPRSGIEMWVTDAALAPDGRTVAVRTYAYLYLFRLDTGGRLTPLSAGPVCLLAGFGAQGEGIGWLGPMTFVLSSEKFFLMPASVAVVRCGG
ncbi:MAG: hypothetical protein ACHQXA_00495, partial [Gemmatimonadales bacterium]